MCNEVLGSRLPLGFMNELQVRLATQTNLPTGSKSREVFVTCEAALVDRIAGSVLTMPYKSGGGKMPEVPEACLLLRQRLSFIVPEAVFYCTGGCLLLYQRLSFIVPEAVF